MSALPPQSCRAGLARLARRFRADAEGATAVEFAMVAVPFFVLMLAIMTVGMQYLALHSLERGVSEASRKIRTGQAQKEGITLADFRDLVCAAAGSAIACDGRLVVHVKSGVRFADLVPMIECAADGGLAPPTSALSDQVADVAGGRSQAVSVTVCYDWEMGSYLWQTLWNFISPTPVNEDGKTILSAATAFRTEPYE